MVKKTARGKATTRSVSVQESGPSPKSRATRPGISFAAIGFPVSGGGGDLPAPPEGFGYVVQGSYYVVSDDAYVIAEV